MKKNKNQKVRFETVTIKKTLEKLKIQRSLRLLYVELNIKHILIVI